MLNPDYQHDRIRTELLSHREAWTQRYGHAIELYVRGLLDQVFRGGSETRSFAEMQEELTAP